MVISGSFIYPESRVLFQEPNTKLILNGENLGNGTVYVSERKLGWQNPEGLGFSVDYPNISLHAVTSDPNVYPTKCLYVMIDGRLTLQGYESPISNGTEEHPDSDAEEEHTEQETTSLIMIPNNLNYVETMFTALSQGQVLNPDPEDCVEEEEDDDNIYEDAEDNYLHGHVRIGDGDINGLSRQMQHNSIQYSYSTENGDVDDNQFEDVD